MSTNIPQELLDTGLEWRCMGANHYRAGNVTSTKLHQSWSVTIGDGATPSGARFAQFVDAVRPTAAEALAVARRMIEAAQ